MKRNKLILLLLFGALLFALSPFYRSLSKLPDVFFFPYLLFPNDSLPELRIDSSRGNVDKILSSPSEQSYYFGLLNRYRAQKLGLLTPGARFMKIFVDGSDRGIFLVSDSWTSTIKRGERVPDNAEIARITDHPEKFAALMKAVAGADDEAFKTAIGLLINLDKFYKWSALAILSGYAGEDFETTEMIFNTATGKLEMVFADMSLRRFQDDYSEKSILAKRIFSITEFREKRNQILREYIQEQAGNDLRFYDSLYKETRGAFLSDFGKEQNNFIFLKQVKDARRTIADNFSAAELISRTAGQHSAEQKDAASLSSGAREFVAQNSMFAWRGENTVALSGVQVIANDIIIPPYLRVIIDPGTVIYLKKGISIVSYSPIIADTGYGAPIRFLRVSPYEAWGSFAVVHTADSKSVLNNIEFNGGSGDLIKGIVFTGMVAFHNADVEITNAIFKNAGDDDALNIKYGKASVTNSFFGDNFSDAVDIDWSPPETVVAHNKFYNNGYGVGGDGIDLSWSDVSITNNEINGCTDKGISVGESSKPIIKNNLISNCDIGVAVKDSSEAEIVGNIIRDSRVGIAAYQKKSVFGGGVANIDGNILDGVRIEYEKDKLSILNIINIK